MGKPLFPRDFASAASGITQPTIQEALTLSIEVPFRTTYGKHIVTTLDALEMIDK